MQDALQRPLVVSLGAQPDERMRAPLLEAVEVEPQRAVDWLIGRRRDVRRSVLARQDVYVVTARSPASHDVVAGDLVTAEVMWREKTAEYKNPRHGEDRTASDCSICPISRAENVSCPRLPLALGRT